MKQTLEMHTLVHSYSNDIAGKKIAILGPYPPPLGGVSVHIERVIHKFRQQKNDVVHFDTLKRFNKIQYTWRLIKFLHNEKPEYVYYHTVDLNSKLIELWLLVAMSRVYGYKIILVEHNCRYLYERSVWYKKQYSYLLKLVNELVMIGHTTYKSYCDNAIYLPNSYSVQAAFLPPDVSNQTLLIASYPDDLQIFMQRHSPLLLVCAFQLVLYDNNDLYGIDLAVESLHHIKKTFESVGLIIAMASIGDIAYYNTLQTKMHTYGLHNNIYLLVGHKELWPLFEKVNLFLRPTRSDAASVSVLEALYFNTPVIASNASIRPEGVILFESGNALQLSCAIESVLKEKKYYEFKKQCDYLYTK